MFWKFKLIVMIAYIELMMCPLTIKASKLSIKIKITNTNITKHKIETGSVTENCTKTVPARLHRSENLKIFRSTTKKYFLKFVSSFIE